MDLCSAIIHILVLLKTIFYKVDLKISNNPKICRFLPTFFVNKTDQILFQFQLIILCTNLKYFQFKCCYIQGLPLPIANFHLFHMTPATKLHIVYLDLKMQELEVLSFLTFPKKKWEIGFRFTCRIVDMLEFMKFLKIFLINNRIFA